MGICRYASHRSKVDPHSPTWRTLSNILEEVKKLLGKGAIELVPPGQEGQGFYSTFFIVPKKDGGHPWCNCDAEGHGLKLVMNSLYTSLRYFL
jgi:hypothetical protein